MVAQYLTLLANAFTQKSQDEHPKPLIDQLAIQPNDSNGIPTIVGYPGSTEKAIEALSSALSAISTSFTEESLQIMEIMGKSIAQLEKPHTEVVVPLLQQASDTMMSIEGLTDGFDEMCSGASQLAQQFAGYTNTLVQDGKPNQTMLTQYGKQFEKVLEMRETYREKRARVIEASQSYILRLRETFDGLKSAMDERKKTLLELFVNIGLAYSEAASKTAMAGARVKEAMEMSFRDDMLAFVKQRKIARYDLRDLEFEAIDTSGPAFEGLDTKIDVQVADIYPIGMAKVVKDYLATDEKQMNCKMGKRLMLMEEPDGDWCYVMNPITLTCGFVPTECLERVKGSLGIVIRQPGLDDGSLSVGDFVMIVETTSSAYITEDVLGTRGISPKHLIGVIYS